ncbi:MAG: 2-C-methyl-D-erythritol 4-phosphate cytidylyltransferase [Saccharospirillum sp.]
MAVHLLLPAAGLGRRFGATRAKQYHPILGRPLIEWTLSLWQRTALDGQRLLIVHPDDREIDALLPRFPDFHLVQGGQERVDSVLSGLAALTAKDDDWVLVHDIARPCVRPDNIEQLLERCQCTGQGGLLAAPMTDTVKRWRQGKVNTLDRAELWAAQTPQCFQYRPLMEALTQARQAGQTITDEASAMEWAGHPVQLVPGSRDNVKLTHPEDAVLIEAVLKKTRLA